MVRGSGFKGLRFLAAAEGCPTGLVASCQLTSEPLTSGLAFYNHRHAHSAANAHRK